VVLASLMWVSAPVHAQAVDIDQVRAATAKLIAQLVEQGVLARDKGEALLSDVAKPAAASPASGNAGSAAGGAATGAGAKGAAGAVRVPYIPEFVRKELKEEIRLELAAQAFREGWTGPGSVPAWVRKLEWDGDLRFRVQLDRFGSGNAPQISITDTNRTRAIALANTAEDRERLRFRARIGLTAKIDENWSGGVRLTTGSATDPLSSNQTLGTYNNRYTVLIDRAYIRYRLGDYSAVAGRMANPWFGTDLMWANDLSFDGVALQWTPKITSDIRGFATLAALPIQEVELASADKWLFGGQIGATRLPSPTTVGAKLGLAYFHYANLRGKPSAAGSTANEFTAPAFAQKGNTYYNISSDPNRPLLGLAADYQLLNLTSQVDIPSIAGKRLIVTGDYVHNFGFDRAAVSQRVGTNVASQVDAYQLRVAFGDADLKALHDWQVFAAYKRVERDALLDAFTDSDFRLGGTDARGYIIGGSYGLGKNTSAAFRYFSGDSISGAPLSIDVFQFDLNIKF
ncbi:MAG: putative porin, partial [Burkholderiaceae bacterium]|nr:putative porin [Burkholderiaceae bacterium]